jgi:hypothetical protein
MALTAILDYTAEVINEDIYTGTITDETVYGGANAARVDVVTYITGEKINQSGEVESDVTFATYDPTAATTYDFDVEKDGYYKFKFAIIPEYDNAVNYDQYDVVYSGGAVYQAYAETPSAGTATGNASYWEVIAEPTSLLDDVGTATESGNLVYKLYERIIYPFSKKGYGDSAEQAALQCCSDCERGEDVKTHEMLAVLIRGMNASDTRSKFIKGEKMARKSQEIIEAQ